MFVEWRKKHIPEVKLVYVCYRSSLCNYAWWETASTRPWWEISKRSHIDPTTQAILTYLQYTIGCLAVKFALGHCEPWRGIPRLFQALSQLILPGIEPTSQIGKITKSSPRRTHCKLWVCFFGWELEGTSAGARNTSSAPSHFNNFRIIFQFVNLLSNLQKCVPWIPLAFLVS